MSAPVTVSGVTAEPGRAFLSIGQVLASLRESFPDVTISKIRFLETEGLVLPERTQSGYRKFSHADVDRLRYVLAAQRDHYLPLRVIKNNLAALDRGVPPPSGGPTRTATRTFSVVEGAAMQPSPVDAEPSRQLSRSDLAAEAGVSAATIATLEQFGLLAPPAGGYFDETALAITRAAAALSAFGVEPRHLRAFRTAADREIGLLEQVLSPLLGQHSEDARVRAEEKAREFSALSVSLHAALVKAGLGPALRR